jgi:Tol biopolymer transport system component
MVMRRPGRFISGAVIAAVATILVAATAESSSTPVTTRVDVSSAGQVPNQPGYGPAISATGRFVAFQSYASDLVPGDTNAATSDITYGSGSDVFVRDRLTGTTRRVSVASDGSQGNDSSFGASISADGRYVAFTSVASNLVPGDTNRVPDVFVHDQRSGTTTRVSVSSTGEQAEGYFEAISGNGRFVAFPSWSTRLPHGDGLNDRLYVHDQRTGQTTLVSRPGRGPSAYGSSPTLSGNGKVLAYVDGSSHIVVLDRATGRRQIADVGVGGRPPNKHSLSPSLSANGRFVAFRSFADNLIRSDRNDGSDVFVRDLLHKKTIRASIRPNGRPLRRCPAVIPDPDGEESYRPSCTGRPSLSASGRYVAFDSGEAPFDGFGQGAFMRDLRRGTTTRVSVQPDGRATNAAPLPAISADGRFVAFQALDRTAPTGSPIYVRGPLH